jgi:iron complex outermembrane recepter protein
MINIFSSLFFAAVTHGQTLPPAPPVAPVPPAVTTASPVVPAEPPKKQKILVTGSYIKRIDEEGPSSVVILKKEQLENTGLNSAGDILRDSVVMDNVGRESSGSSAAGVSTASIHGFGSDSILVLLNGLRLPKFGGGNSVDLNLIPLAALEQVEILKDGASALYGSDAVGGVINFITKKDYNTSDVNVNYSLPEEKGGNRFDFAASSGITRKKYSLMGVVQYRKNTAIYDKDRSYSRMTDIANEGSTIGSPGTWVDTVTGAKNAPGCPPGNLINGFCGFDYTKYSTGLPSIEQASGLLSGSYTFSPTLKLSSSVTASHRKTFWQFAPAPDRFQVSGAQAVAWGLAGANPANDVRVYYRLKDELGSRMNDNIMNALTTQVSLDGKFAPDWDWQLSGTYGQSRTDITGTSGYADKSVLKNLYSSGQFNPFKAAGLPRDDISSASWNPTQDITNTQSGLRFVTTTQVYSGGKYFGPIGMAVGTSSDFQEYRERVDRVTSARDAQGQSMLFGGSGSNGAGKRSSQAAFTEFSLFPTDTVEIGIAARYDHFSDFGDTVNPKVSASWQASDKFLLKASTGTGFRAPNLDSLYAGDSFGYPTFIDRVACVNGVVNGCSAQQYGFFTRGNPNLKEERSRFYNIGFVAQPKKNWSISVDGWAAVIDNQVSLDLTEITIAEQRLGAAAMLNNYGINIKRDVNGELISIDALDRNLASTKLSGMDISIKNQSQTQLFGKTVKVLFGMDHSQYFPVIREVFPGNGVKKNRDNFWKNNTHVTVSRHKANYTIAARSIAGGDKSANEGDPGVVGYGTLPVYTEWDLNFTYTDFYHGVLGFGVRNLFGSQRPLDDSTGVPNARLNTSIYDPVGRAFHASYSYSF